MPLLESYVSDGIYHKLENSTIYPLTSTMQNGAMMFNLLLYVRKYNEN